MTALLNDSLVDSFQKSFPIQPQGLAVATMTESQNTTLLIADGTPSSRIFDIENPTASGASLGSQLFYAPMPIVGRNCNIKNVQSFTNGSMVNDSTTIASPSYMVIHPTTGDVFFSQPYSVMRLERVQHNRRITFYFGGGEDRRPNVTAHPAEFTFGSSIKRWDAATQNPRQLALDVDNQTMYVAEMTSVRAIDMLTGDARIILGGLGSPMRFPSALSNCSQSPDTPCDAASVLLLAPRGLAFYRRIESSTNALLEWLFVSDAIGAIIYRLDLRMGGSGAGAVTVIAGQPLHAGNTDGSWTASQLMFPTSLAVGRRHLFVVDSGAVRVMELDGARPIPPTPAPIDPSPSAPTEVFVTATVVASVATSGAATLDVVPILMISSIACVANSNSKASFLTTLFFFVEELNVLVVQPWLLVALWFVIAVLNALIARVPIMEMFKSGSAKGKYPKYALLFGELILPLSAFVGWHAVFSDDASVGDIFGSLVAVVVAHAGLIVPAQHYIRERVSLAYFTAHHWELTTCSGDSVENSSIHSSGSKRSNPSMDAVNTSTLHGSFTSLMDENRPQAPLKPSERVVSCEMDYMLPKGAWHPSSIRAPLGTLFAKFEPPFKTKKPLEYVPPLATAFLTGVATISTGGAGCPAAMFIIAAIYLVTAGVISVFRVYRRPLDNPLTAAAHTTFAVVCILKGAVPTNTNAASVVQIIQSVCLFTKVVYGVYVWYRERPLLRAAALKGDQVHSRTFRQGFADSDDDLLSKQAGGGRGTAVTFAHQLSALDASDASELAAMQAPADVQPQEIDALTQRPVAPQVPLPQHSMRETSLSDNSSDIDL